MTIASAEHGGNIVSMAAVVKLIFSTLMLIAATLLPSETPANVHGKTPLFDSCAHAGTSFFAEDAFEKEGESSKRLDSLPAADVPTPALAFLPAPKSRIAPRVLAPKPQPTARLTRFVLNLPPPSFS